MEILEWVKKQTGKLADNVKDYKFYVKNEPNFIDSSTTLVLTPFTNRDQLATVPCVYRWSRIKNGLLSEVPEFKGNSFICQPSDIGCIIQAEVTSTDGGHPGTAVLKFGPVKLDVLIKKQVEHALTSGSAVMNVDLVQKDQIRQCQVKITQQTIKISHCNSNNQYTFQYTLGEPRIEANIKQPSKVQIFFSEKYEEDILKFANTLFGFQDLSPSSINQSNQKKLELRFSNRALKDNFLLIVKAFNTKKAMKTSAIITKIQNVDLSNNDNFNYVLQIQSLRADLIKLARLNDKYLSDKRMYYEQARKLQKQIQQIIVTYTKIAQGKCKDQSELDQSVYQLRQKRDEVMERKLHKLMQQNQTLRDRIQFINQQMALKQGGVMRSNSGTQNQTSPRGGFIKKRVVPQVPVNAFDNILQKLDQSEVKDQVQQDKIMLAKKLNQSVVKIAKLQQKIKEMKHNQTVMNLNNSQLSNASVDSKQRLNMTAMELNSAQKQKFLVEIDELRRKNMKLKEQNQKLKSQVSVSGSQHQMRQDDARSQRSSYSNMQVIIKQPPINTPIKSQAQLSNTQTPKFSTPEYQKDLCLRIQQLTAENQRLKQQVQRLTIQKQLILKQKSALQAKYKKKMGDLANENSMYKRNQDALNRSQNLSMQMDAYNEQQNNLLKQQNQVLMNQNLKIGAMYNKAMEQLKTLSKLKEQNLKLKASLNEYTRNGLPADQSQGQINL